MKNFPPQTIRKTLGLWRSLLIYYGMPLRNRRLSHFYKPFIHPGDLCFDLGAHVGSRIQAWNRLDARIVALEPQPDMMAFLRRRFGRHANVILLQEAVGARAGETTMYLSRQTPTVSTLSPEWISAVKSDESFSWIKWDDQITVSVTTLDKLIAAYGLPTFCKIDVEGYELEVLRGLSQPIPNLSFEYIPMAIKEVSLQCIERLVALGDYVFNFSPEESHCFHFSSWLDAHQMMEKLVDLQNDGRIGDIYARLAEAVDPL